MSYLSARDKFAEVMKQVCDDHAPIAITRAGADTVVMISMADYKALEETAYLLRSAKNTRRLIDSIEELSAGLGSVRVMLE
ncbi:MAG: type II toxin-antitoxin system Phd/YefM family antitoxin [Congregibacter sp.]